MGLRGAAISGATGRYDIVRIARVTRPKDAMPAAKPPTSTQSIPLNRRMFAHPPGDSLRLSVRPNWGLLT